MSTKSSIKWKEWSANGTGFHLYDDVLDSFENDDPPVYLRLDNVQVELETTHGGACITVTIPRATARELGLLPSLDAAQEKDK